MTTADSISSLALVVAIASALISYFAYRKSQPIIDLKVFKEKNWTYVDTTNSNNHFRYQEILITNIGGKNVSLISIHDKSKIIASLQFAMPAGATIKQAEEYVKSNLKKEWVDFPPPFNILVIDHDIADLTDTDQLQEVLKSATEINRNSFAPIEGFDLLPGQTKILRYGILTKDKIINSASANTMTTNLATITLALLFNHGRSKTIVNHIDLLNKKSIKRPNKAFNADVG